MLTSLHHIISALIISLMLTNMIWYHLHYWWKILLLLILPIIQVSILLFTPYFSRVIMQLQLQPQEFVRGLAIDFIFVYRVGWRTILLFQCNCVIDLFNAEWHAMMFWTCFVSSSWWILVSKKFYVENKLKTPDIIAVY